VTATRRSDIEFGEVALEAAAPDCRPEPQYREPVRTVADNEHNGLVARDQADNPFGELSNRRRWLVELTVELEKQPRDDDAIVDSGAPR
jgi:hypothetical protein